MRFWQKYYRFEDGFGLQPVLFAVSDSYEELFTDTGTETDIYLLESVKKDLNTEEGSFAIDELPLSINHFACDSVDDEKAMYFCLDAANIKVNRYCVLFMGETAALADMLFIGKIGNKISGDDKLWSGVDYAYVVNPIREYKLSAFSFDISTLDDVMMADDSKKDLEGIPVKSLYARFKDENWTTLKAIFDYRLSHSISGDTNNLAYNCPLGNLYKVLGAFLDKAGDYLSDYLSLSLSFNIVEGSLGIQTCPTSYKLKDESKYELDPVNPRDVAQTVRIELKMSNTDSGTGWSAPFIHRRLVFPELGNALDEDWKNALVADERIYSFLGCASISALLFEIARAFGCYLFLTYTTGNTINLEFVSRKGLVEEGYTYLVGVSDANLDTSSDTNSASNRFYSLANNYAVDELDFVPSKWASLEAEPSKLFAQAKSDRESLENTRGIKSQRIFFSTSATTAFVVFAASNKVQTWAYPLNTISDISSWNTHVLQQSGLAGFTVEHLTTALFVKTIPMETTQIERLGTTPVWRPAMKIFTQFNGDNLDFSSLAKYINYILENDVQYYKTEYTLKLPFWSGFSKNSDGSSPSWKNIKLGSKMKIAEHVRRYDDATSTWLEEDVQRDYVVVGIETNLQEVETTLKLHSLERFAFGWWDGDEGLLVPMVQPPNYTGEYNPPNGIGLAYYTVETGETINDGDAVMVTDVATVAKSTSKMSATRGSTTIGIAKEAGTAGDSIMVQVSGRVTSDAYNFELVGGQLFVRTNDSGLNVNELILEGRTADEDLLVVLGEIDSPNSFIMNIRHFPFRTGVNYR